MSGSLRDAADVRLQACSSRLSLPLSFERCFLIPPSSSFAFSSLGVGLQSVFASRQQFPSLSSVLLHPSLKDARACALLPPSASLMLLPLLRESYSGESCVCE